MSKTSKRKSGEDRKSRSSSVGSREKRLSVFDRLGTKAPAVDQLPLPTNCRHNLHHGSCPHCSLKLSPHTLVNSLKRGSKKEVDLRQGEEGGSCSRKGSPEGVDWSHWDQSDLEYEDEKALERRRQLLQRELELQMKNDSRNYPSTKKRSSSSSSTSSSESSTVPGGIGSSSSSISSGLPPLSQLQPDLKKLNSSNLDLTSIKKTILGKMVYKERSPSGKSSSKRGLSPALRKSGSSSGYKRKSISPAHPSSSRKQSPHKQRILSSRRKETESRGRSRQRSTSRERRRERSKEIASTSRHRQRSPRSQHSSSQRRSSDRKKDDDRIRREDTRRDRRTDSRDSRREHHDELRSREKAREKERLEAYERCRERQREREVARERREKVRTSRSSQQRREKDTRYARSQESKHYQLSPPPATHNHYRERSRYSSSERERLTIYKEPSPREPETRIRVSQGSDASRLRRRGWEAGATSATRYESSSSHKSSSSRDWVDPGHTSAERVHRDWERVIINDWPARSQRDSLIQEERRSKHSQDKDYSASEKDKEIDWKRERVRESEETIHSNSKRQRIEEPSLPPPPICEAELSDISDDPDDILNRDDIEECGTEERGSDDILKEEELHQMSTSSSTIDHRLLDPRIGDDEGMDSLVFEEISDEELEEDSKNKGGDALGVDWASLIAECRSIKKPSQDQGPGSAKRMWDTNNIFRRLGVSRKYAGDNLFNSIQQKLTEDGGEGLLSEVGGMERGLAERKSHHLLLDNSKKALSARLDLAIRRELCGLPMMAINSGPLCQFQIA